MQHQLKNVQAIQATYSAFAAILFDGSVVTWGQARCGGRLTHALRNIVQIASSHNTFHALSRDGRKWTWGFRCVDEKDGVQHIATSDGSVACIYHDKQAESFGDVRFKLQNVQHIQANEDGFCCILGDGSVSVWL